MKEVIRQIKKGNLRFYISLVEKYIGSVYSEAESKYEEKKAIEVTLDVFVKLFSDIKNSFKWQNGNHLVRKSITKTCKKYNIKFKHLNDIHVQVPPVIMRKLYVELSKNSRKGSRYKIAFVAVVIIAMVFSATFLDLNSFFRSPDKTIYNINPSEEIIYEVSYGDIDGPAAITHITNLQDKGVVVDIYLGNKHSCEILYLGQKLNSFELPMYRNFAYGYLEKDSLVFKDSKRLFQYSVNGELKNSIEINGVEVAESENKRFLALKQEDNTSKIFDLAKFEFVDEVKGKVITISNNGYVITNKDSIHETLSTSNDIKQVVCLKAFSFDKAVVVYNTGEVALYDNEILEWQKPVTISKKVKNELGNNTKVKNAYVFANDDTVNVVMEYDQKFILQSFNTFDGTERLNTLDSLQIGTISRTPSISPDYRILCLESKKTWSRYYTVGSVDFVDVSTFPMKRIAIDVGNLFSWACESQQDERYMYVSGDSALKVVKIVVD